MSTRVFATADTHFGHEEAIRIFDRPYADVSSMDDGLVEGINAVVGPDDLLYHLGDFTGPVGKGGKTLHACEMRARIACKRIILLRGNHDPRDDPEFDALFESVHDILSIKGWASGDVSGPERVVLCHYALRIWQGRHNGSLHLYGHSHGTLEEIGRSTDVGIDCWRMRPQPLESILLSLRDRPADLPKERPRIQPVRGA